MKWFNNIIVNWGKSIESSREAKEKLAHEKAEQEKQARYENYLKEREEIASMKKVLFDWVKEKAQSFNIEGYYAERAGKNLDYKVGDIVVVNKYNLRMDSSNSWDGGANILLGRGGYNYDENPKPLLCKVTKITVDLLFADELIDRFIEKSSMKELIGWKNNIVGRYESWLRKRNDRNSYVHQVNNIDSNSIFDEHGIYVTVHFDTIDWDFQPQWGLNMFAFLPESSEEGKETLNTWKQIYENNEAIKELSDKQTHLKASVDEATKVLRSKF